MTEIITGTVVNIIYQNSETLYTVMDIDSDGVLVRVTGNFAQIKDGLDVRVTGRMINHPRFGEQFQADTLEIVLENDEKALLKFLSSGIIKGIGEKKARQIVDMFGADAIDILENDPMKLTAISGIGRKTALNASNAFREQKDVSRIIMELSRYGISANFSKKLYSQYGSRTIETIQQNPYALIDEVYGIGFKKADEIAMNVGVDALSPYRITSAITYFMQQTYMSGDTFVYLEQLVDGVSKLIESDTDIIEENLSTLLLSGEIIMEKEDETEKERYYLDYLYNAEFNSAVNLGRILRTESPEDWINFDFYLKRFENEEGITLNDEQRDAVKRAVLSKASIITGGPGTGKTTIINAVLYILESLGKTFLLAAPTGRAAKRMSEAAGEEAKTIHRLLEYEYSPDGTVHIVFGKNEDNRLDADFIIIDEMSMVDITLFDSLMKAVKDTTSLVFVGDADQLPSVGPGNVLGDLIESEVMPVSRLKHIYRQNENSLIKTNAARINEGKLPEINNSEESDFFFINIITQEKIRQRIVRIIENRKNSPLKDFDMMNDFQIICPLKRGSAGVFELNRITQELLNPKSRFKNEFRFGQTVFREGDKVMQLKNNYDIEWENRVSHEYGKGLFNGDIGIIQRIDPLETFTEILFDDEKTVKYPKELIQEITLSYAITIHKSQGNEFRAVIIPVYHGYPAFMTRNLLYTALTRAKELAIIVGEPQVMKFMIGNTRTERRKTSLSEKLTALHAFT